MAVCLILRAASSGKVALSFFVLLPHPVPAIREHKPKANSHAKVAVPLSERAKKHLAKGGAPFKNAKELRRIR